MPSSEHIPLTKNSMLEEFLATWPRLLATPIIKSLVAKIHFYGIQRRGASWLRSYLADRKQKVHIK